MTVLTRRELGQQAAVVEAEAAAVRSNFTLGPQTSRAAIEARQRSEIAALKRAGATRARLEAVQAKHRDEIIEGERLLGERARRLRHTVAVKGRIDGLGRQVWDLFRLDGDAQPKLVRSGFVSPEEAMQAAGDLVLGRVPVSLAGVRGVFRRSSGLLLPDHSVDVPGRQGVRVGKVGDAVVVSAPKQAPVFEQQYQQRPPPTQ